MNSIEFKHISFKTDDKTILKDISFDLPEGHSMAIVGPSGCGKTTLGRLIAQKLIPSSGEILFPEGAVCQMVEQQDNFMTVSRIGSSYYGQRYENQGMDEAPSVQSFLQQTTSDVDWVMLLMDIAHLKNSKLMQLSNGERKRTQLAAALLEHPDLLVLDQPFVGLDVLSRQKLTTQIGELHQSGKAIVLICDPLHLPEQMDWVLVLGNGRLVQWVRRADYIPERLVEDAPETMEHSFAELQVSSEDQFEFAVKMNAVNVVHGEREILKNINWTVRKGERWALMGPNGAGKTTLLSLITADNPQGYVNDLTLFDRKRGSGESIWDIKKRIGYVSPELHLYFLRGKGIFNTIPGLEKSISSGGNSLRCDEVITSGFNDQIGFSSSNSDYQKKAVKAWFPILQLEHLSDSRFADASLSEQRLLLLARALVKMPSLLILDEPCQGLDSHQIRRFTRMLDVICSHLETTVIYVTHYPEEIPQSVTKLLQLENGQVKFCGSFFPES
ncbi:molybdenum transport ATP-binding protein modF [Aquipluma nitroreducens]|uniref:Molybdenum transport ATP-binding protein modF n=1 Tax=Aquipluma nitroreducens TaxID=2010828 RepID=A0A5K7SBI2_9BACT|nr:ATP-binding cassette domain-containing protein [Aquipluma nitroreducens]BBE18807.1 molybdenum transport ATP-binding protein modF [Aquipluma nitroreducens]